MPRKRGPKTAFTDAELTEQIRGVLARSPFVGEGYRKVWARLRLAGVRAGKPRVLRLMREANLLAPTRTGQPHGPAAHDGTIIPDRPDAMWGIDATAGWTDEGPATVFIAVDHFTAECVGIHAARRGTRFEALEPLRQGIRAALRRLPRGRRGRPGAPPRPRQPVHERPLPDRAALPGIASSPAFVREPEGNGCAERFIRTLKEQLLWIERFDSVEALRLALLAFKDRYNTEWLIERHGHQTPAAVRAAFAADVAA